MIIDGKAIANRRLEILRNKIQDTKIVPKLEVVMVGEAAESQLYVRMKAKRAEEAGITAQIIVVGGEAKEKELREKIMELSEDKTVHGILVQLPFPDGSPAQKKQREILETIDPTKDVDCLTSANMGLLAVGCPRFYPATVKGVLMAIQEALNNKTKAVGGSSGRLGVNGMKDKKLGMGNEDWILETQDKYILGGMTAVVVGRSEIVGKPMVMALLNLGATVTVCNSSTSHLSLVTREADILISATGAAHLITADMVKPGAVVVDVGINAKEGKVTGDVDFENVSRVAAAISPVPGGVGPLTISSLLENTFEAAKIQLSDMASVD